VLDGDWQNPIGGGKIGVGALQFFGVIDAGPTGFTEIQFRETDGKVGQALYIFADDFWLLAERPDAPPKDSLRADRFQRAPSRRETSRTSVSFK